MGLVVPAVLPSSKQELEEKLEFFSRIPSATRVQVDVVDGKFVSPASWPYSAKAAQGKPSEFEVMVRSGEMLPHLDHFEYEIDLMCFDPDRVAGAWLALGATRLIFHSESATNLPRLIASARKRYGGGEFSSLISFGLAINIASDLALIEPCLDDIEFVQFMGIAQIGLQGQPFDQRVLEKVRVFHAHHPEIPMQVDGGISLENAKELVTLGVSNLVIGSGTLRSSDPTAAITAFEELQSPYGV